jgi:hypothetical protein
MQKILELKNADWMKGVSAQPNLPVGGLFQRFSGCDPFEQGGLALPSLTGVQQALATTPRVITNFNIAGVGYIYSHSDTKLYQVLTVSPFTVVDVTAQIYQHISGGLAANKIFNSIIWKGSYVYASQNSSGTIELFANSIPVAAGNDIVLHSGVGGSTTADFMPMCVGADGNLYTGNYFSIGVITSVTGTTGNATTHNIDDGYTIRDMVSDGRYLVIIADNNTIPNSGRITGKYKCKIYFWDMVQTDAGNRIIADVIYEINDSYLIAAKFLENGVYVFGYNGIYVCNIATSPRMIRPFLITVSSIFGRPVNPAQLIDYKGSIYWVDGVNALSDGILAYGNPITGDKKIWYQPYHTDGTLATALSVAGNNFIVGSTLGLQFFNTGTTRGQMVIQTLDTNMLAPHRFDYVKVVLGQPLSAGQSVICQVYSQNHTKLMSTETKSYTAANSKQQLMFRPVKTTTNQPDRFEDIDVLIISNGAPAPLEDGTEDL